MTDLHARHHHLPQLQSLRGIAASIVLVHHCLFFYATPPAFRRWSEYLFNAHAAVTLFFVLSGFVLTRALHGNRMSPGRLSAYLIRRFTRIYPAVWCGAAMGLISLSLRAWPPAVMLSPWALTQESNVVGLKEIILTSLGVSATIIRPMWSIKEELAASLFLIPIFAVLLAGRKGFLLLHGAILLAMIVGAFASGKIALLYLAEFGIGAALVVTFPSGDEDRAARREFAPGGVLVAAGCVLLFARIVNENWRFEPNYDAPVPALIEAAAAALFIRASLMSRRAERFLGNASLQKLGDVSFSLYLLHYSIMEISSRLLAVIPGYGALSTIAAPLVLTAVTASVSLPLALLAYRYIELPGMRLGRLLERQVDCRSDPPVQHHS